MLIYDVETHVVIGEHSGQFAQRRWYNFSESVRGKFELRPVADEILRALKVAGSPGLTRTEINKHVFSGHKSAERIGAALELLKGATLHGPRVGRLMAHPPRSGYANDAK